LIAVIVGLFAIYSLSASAVALIALFTVAVHRRLRTAVLVAAGYALTSFLTLLVRPDMSPPNWWQGVLGVICVVAVLALGMFVRARRQLTSVERERAASEQEFRVAQARQMERNRIAREMHDVLAHRLSLLSLQAGALELWPDAPPAEVARAAGLIRGNAHGALEDLREVIGVLRSARAGDDHADGVPEKPQPTLVDLPMLIDESQKAGMRVLLECDVADLGGVPEAMGRTAFRIVQEGLTNARKHANHAEVSVAVRGGAADGLTVEIRNPWPVGVAGTTPIPGAGMGIIGLAERTALSGGRLEHGDPPAHSAHRRHRRERSPSARPRATGSAQRAGTRGCHDSGPGQVERGDQWRAVHERGDSEAARLTDPHQARPQQPDPDRSPRPRRRPGR
jgi:signal transduction histidine kinase